MSRESHAAAEGAELEPGNQELTEGDLEPSSRKRSAKRRGFMKAVGTAAATGSLPACLGQPTGRSRNTGNGTRTDSSERTEEYQDQNNNSTAQNTATSTPTESVSELSPQELSEVTTLPGSDLETTKWYARKVDEPEQTLDELLLKTEAGIDDEEYGNTDRELELLSRVAADMFGRKHLPRNQAIANGAQNLDQIGGTDLNLLDNWYTDPATVIFGRLGMVDEMAWEDEDGDQHYRVHDVVKGEFGPASESKYFDPESRAVIFTSGQSFLNRATTLNRVETSPNNFWKERRENTIQAFAGRHTKTNSVYLAPTFDTLMESGRRRSNEKGVLDFMIGVSYASEDIQSYDSNLAELEYTENTPQTEPVTFQESKEELKNDMRKHARKV